MTAADLPARIDAPADDVTVARAELADALDDAERLAAGGGTGTDLVTTRSTDPVEAKRQIARVQAKLRKQQAIVKVAADKLDRAMKAELERVQQILAPMEEAVRRLEQGLFSVNLYLGRDENIRLLRDGESAPAEAPITLRQMLLFMDEEIAADAGEVLMPTDVEKFDEWLLADLSHLDQVLPETKGIVALRPRRKQPRDGYRDRGRDAEAEERANSRTYWLVRNGERVYRTVTELELDDRVLPHVNEIERLFVQQGRGLARRRERKMLAPGSFEWERAQERAEARERTYMRVALVLEGLLHRTPLFHPLPDAGVSFLDPRCLADGRVRYITDAEGALGTGRESFSDWRRRLAEELRPGMRIVLGPGLSRHADRDVRGNPRLQPRIANLPETSRVYVLESRAHSKGGLYDNAGTMFVFRYHEGARYVGDGGWGGGEWREPARRASCRVFARDEFVLPFDLATVEEMERFLHSRTDRYEYEEMFPILRAAIAAKLREAEAEEPFRLMLIGTLARDNGVPVEEAREAVPDLVEWWKLKNRLHRPLLLEAQRPEEPEDSEELREIAAGGPRSRRARAAQETLDGDRQREAKEAAEQVERSARAVRMIVAEHKRRLADHRRPVDEFVVEVLRAQYPHRLLIARPRGRGYLVVVAAEAGVNAYVHEYEYTARGALRETREWVLPRLTTTKTWRVIEQDERWLAWDFEATADLHVTGPEREELRRLALARFEKLGDGLVVAVARDGLSGACWRLDELAEIDEEHLLTVGLKPPIIEALPFRWQRRASGVGWREQREGTVAVRRGDVWPWEEKEWRSLSDEDDGPPQRKYTVLKTDGQLMRLLASERARYNDAAARAGRMQKRSGALTASVEHEWIRRAWEAERVRFDGDFGDSALWPAHRESKERHIVFPSKWRLERYSHELRSGQRLRDAVERFVESGEDPAGRTVGDVLREATERWGGPGEEYNVHTSAGIEKRRDDRSFRAAKELHDFVLSEYVFEHEPDPVEGDDGDGDDLGLADAVLADVRRALDDEEDDEVEYDIDGEAIDDGLLDA